MKITKVLAIAATLSLIAACGSSGSSPAPTPTTPEQQAASGASVDMAQQAAGNGAQNGLQQFGPAAMVLKAAATGATKASETKQINVTESCGDVADAGSYTVTGSMTADCTITETTGECTISSTTMDTVFNSCAKSITIGGTTYQTVLTGTATATLAGSISVDLTTDPVTFTAVNFSGSLGGTVAVGGDVEGTVALSGVTYSGAGTSEPTISCGGTCAVTLTGEAAATCGVATTCEGCTE